MVVSTFRKGCLGSLSVIEQDSDICEMCATEFVGVSLWPWQFTDFLGHLA